MNVSHPDMLKRNIKSDSSLN